MEPVRKQLTCPSCGATAVVRVMPGSDGQRWQCPACKKMQTSDKASIEAAPAAEA